MLIQEMSHTETNRKKIIKKKDLKQSNDEEMARDK